MPTFISPIPGALVTSGWGDPREYRGGVHRGLDFRAAVGTPVKAIASGKIFHSGSSPDPNAGKWVGIDHGAWSSRYLHLDQPLVAKGASVAQGEIIGYSGSTGVQRSAPHLHFDLAVKDLSAYPLAIAGALLGEKKNWGWQVPAEPLIPANYSPEVAARAKARGLVIAATVGTFWIVAGIGLAWLLLRKS